MNNDFVSKTDLPEGSGTRNRRKDESNPVRIPPPIKAVYMKRGASFPKRRAMAILTTIVAEWKIRAKEEKYVPRSESVVRLPIIGL